MHTHRHACTHMHDMCIGRHIYAWACTHCIPEYTNPYNTLSYMCSHTGFTSVSRNCQEGVSKGDGVYTCPMTACSGWYVYSTKGMTAPYLGVTWAVLLITSSNHDENLDNPLFKTFYELGRWKVSDMQVFGPEFHPQNQYRSWAHATTSHHHLPPPPPITTALRRQRGNPQGRTAISI